MNHFPWGKYQDMPLPGVPESYLLWCLGQSKALIEMIEGELTWRENAQNADSTVVEKIIKAGYRALAQQYHPDRGGNTQQMQQLNAAMELLRELTNEGQAKSRNPMGF